PRRFGARPGDEGPDRAQGCASDEPDLPARQIPRLRARQLDDRNLPKASRQRAGTPEEAAKELVGDSNGVIVRTAAEGATDTDLGRDVERLAKRWETIEKKSKSTKVLAPQLLYSEPDMIVRIIRDVFNED